MTNPRGAETITVHPAGTANEWGERVPGDPYPIERCAIWPRTSSEDAERGEVPIGGYNVYIPAGGNAITAYDSVTARGSTHTVEGFPAHYIAKDGADYGVLLVLARVGGERSAA